MKAPSTPEARARILVVDDEDGIRETLSGILEDEGYRAATADSAAAALALLRRENFQLVLLDVWLPDGDGLDLLSKIREGFHTGPVIVISGHGNIDSAVRAIRLGAYDFLEKPLSLSRVLLTVAHALEHSRMELEIADLATQLGQKEILVGESPKMRELTAQLAVAAQSDSRILITGENGTGKELVARRIHRLSKRRQRPFVAVNCAAIPDELIESELFGHVKGAFTGAIGDRRGRFEQANGGTLFLDEIADMSLRTQAKVLRVLEDQRFERVGSTTAIEVDVRVLAASNKDLEKEIASERFREDLYFRLSVIPLHVPALRERREDINTLSEHFLAHFAREVRRVPKQLSQEALRSLEQHAWPGNVRELRNLMERLMIMVPGEIVDQADLPQALRNVSAATRQAVSLAVSTTAALPLGSLKEMRDHFEKSCIEQGLAEHQGNVTQTALALGLERSHLHRKIRQYGIEIPRG